ncbi:MAG: DUF1294 domain-containing protein [Lachnospiraceae bacterium]|nr:DUF1294 domain-containing protein [Lachnospiraceae bacterium]
MRVYTVIAIYLAIINLIGFVVMGIDKNRAKKRAFRIPEATLFTMAIIGGSIGTILGMHIFRHKTRHWYFLYGMPVILILQIIIVIVLVMGPFRISII